MGGGLGENLNGKILGVTDQISSYWSGINFGEKPFIILDILLVSVIIYWAYLIIKETRAMRILYGILILIILFLIGQIFQLSTLNFMLRYLVTMILVAIPIVFQPELRSALERLGRTRIVGEFAMLKKNEISLVIADIVQAVKLLAKSHVGALIVLAQKTGLRDIIEKGKKINAAVTPDLLVTIFTPQTPLHDGAVIISGNKIIAASCMLPLSEDEFSYNIGSRHRAAVGLTNQTDAIVIVVSEETGGISVAFNGQLSRDLAPKELEEFLMNLLQKKATTKDEDIKTHRLSMPK